MPVKRSNGEGCREPGRSGRGLMECCVKSKILTVMSNLIEEAKGPAQLVTKLKSLSVVNDY